MIILNWIIENPGWSYLVWEVILWVLLRFTKEIMPSEYKYKLSAEMFLFFWLCPIINMTFSLVIILAFISEWFYKKTYLFWRKLKFIIFG